MPKGTKVARCVKKVEKTVKPRKGQDKKGAAIAICQKSTGQSYQTGKKLGESVMKNNRERRALNNFIQCICNKDFSKAYNEVHVAVEEKIKNRIKNAVATKF